MMQRGIGEPAAYRPIAVGRNTPCQAIEAFGLRSPEEVGERLQAGTNCGSCIPELHALIGEVAKARA